MEIQFPGPAEIILSSTSSFVECFSLEPTRNILNLPTQISKEPVNCNQNSLQKDFGDN